MFFMENIVLEKRPSQLSPSGAARTAQGLSRESVTSGASQVEWRQVLDQLIVPNLVGSKCWATL